MRVCKSYQSFKFDRFLKLLSIVTKPILLIFEKIYLSCFFFFFFNIQAVCVCVCWFVFGYCVLAHIISPSGGKGTEFCEKQCGRSSRKNVCENKKKTKNGCPTSYRISPLARAGKFNLQLDNNGTVPISHFNGTSHVGTILLNTIMIIIIIQLGVFTRRCITNNTIRAVYAPLTHYRDSCGTGNLN